MRQCTGCGGQAYLVMCYLAVTVVINRNFIGATGSGTGNGIIRVTNVLECVVYIDGASVSGRSLVI